MKSPAACIVLLLTFAASASAQEVIVRTPTQRYFTLTVPGSPVDQIIVPAETTGAINAVTSPSTIEVCWDVAIGTKTRQVYVRSFLPACEPRVPISAIRFEGCITSGSFC